MAASYSPHYRCMGQPGRCKSVSGEAEIMQVQFCTIPKFLLAKGL